MGVIEYELSYYEKHVLGVNSTDQLISELLNRRCYLALSKMKGELLVHMVN
jgi:hypothetical protein